MVRLRRALTLGALLLGTLSLALPAFAADDHVVRLELQGLTFGADGLMFGNPTSTIVLAEGL